MTASKTPAPSEDAIGKMIRSCVLMRTRLISRIVTAIYDEELRPFGIGSAQFVLLMVIFRLQPATRAEIGRYHHQDRSTLARNLKVIFAEGWAEESQAAEGGRRKPVVLTQAGIDLLNKVEPAWEVGQARVKALLGKEGAATVMGVANGVLKAQASA